MAEKIVKIAVIWKTSLQTFLSTCMADSIHVIFRVFLNVNPPTQPLAKSCDVAVGYSADDLPSLNPHTQRFTDRVNMDSDIC